MSASTTANLKHGTITLSSGSISHVWHTQKAPARAIVVLQHGFCEYAERYIDSHHSFIRELSTAGYAVYALDMWGHGRSPGTRGVTHIGKAVQDHVELRKLAGKDKLPIILFGHSLGGLVTAGSATMDPENIKGVIMTGPALPDLLPSIARAAVGVLARSMPTVSVPMPGAGLDGLTRDKEEIKRFTSDPLVPQRQIPFLIAVTALDIMQKVNSGLKEWEVPTLVIHGTADTYTELKGSEKFVNGISSEDKTFRKYEDGRHELLHDPPCADEVLREIMEWIEKHT
ncbi:alpha/beta-hydrolase [Macroventuria anomochaeta]|uniref:Alpha/beta-hydrolase n=1 Tax=Macroventuria anomochaeta TaxID=301207 RepID=A0ACB6S2R3_9PLEO|nr:alpha/beta-hydrolase [Macroventuria anomochaeta]KAF2627683.1 alpha/beta-hydrolase [Macroventuria anomochaeta]